MCSADCLGTGCAASCLSVKERFLWWWCWRPSWSPQPSLCNLGMRCCRMTGSLPGRLTSGGPAGGLWCPMRGSAPVSQWTSWPYISGWRALGTLSCKGQFLRVKAPEICWRWGQHGQSRCWKGKKPLSAGADFLSRRWATQWSEKPKDERGAICVLHQGIAGVQCVFVPAGIFMAEVFVFFNHLDVYVLYWYEHRPEAGCEHWSE